MVPEVSPCKGKGRRTVPKKKKEEGEIEDLAQGG